jgi:hypothetical protein
MRRSVRVFATLSLTAAGCFGPHRQVEELPGISELRIVDQRTIYMKMPGGMMQHLSKDGGLIEDRYYIDTETGALTLGASARHPDEVTITIDEQASLDTGTGSDRYQLLGIKGGTVHLHHARRSRQGQTSERDIAVTPYRTSAPP